jgi:RNA recognition motif-containing protein
MNIYVGNLSFEASEDDLRQAFEAFGTVASVTILKDKFTGKSRGFAFVEMPNNDEATAAISGLNGNELNGRALKVNEALPQKERGSDDRGDRHGGGGGGRRF